MSVGGLGKGLDNLIPSTLINDQLQRAAVVENVPVDQISPNSQQPRKDFRPEPLESLAASIRTHGILQPLIVTKTTNGFELIAGERRWRAAKQIGLSHVPVIVRSSSEQQKLELALIENLQRDDLSILETAEAFWALAQQFNLTYEDIGKRVGRSLSSVKNIIRLLGLPESAKEALQSGTITEGHARQILALRDSVKQKELLELIIQRGWSVRQAEQFTKTYKQKGIQKTQAMRRVLASTPTTKRWEAKLGAPVHVQHTANASRLIIDFPDEATLERWTEKLF
jgi:ParB family chromosome partitioning protein